MSDNRQKIDLSTVTVAADPAGQAYRVPVDLVKLPSRGAVYPVENALHRREAIEIRAMTARDEDILTSRALLKQGKAISTLLQSCIMDKSIDPDDMLTGDRNAVLIALRASGYGAEYGASVQCSDCDEEFEHEFHLGSFPIRFLDAEPLQPGTNMFEFRLPRTGMAVRFRLLSGKDERDLSQQAEKRKKALGPAALESNVTSTLLHHIISIDGEADRGKLARLIKDIPAGDSLALRTHIARMAPGLDMIATAECPACLSSVEVEMPLGADFFWPDAGR